MSVHRVALLGSRPLAERVLRELVGRDDLDVVGAVTPPRGTLGWWRSDLAAVADDLGVPVVAEEDLLRAPLDLALSVNHTRLIREPLLSWPKRGFVNVHHSHALRIRGRNCGAWAILEARETGVWEHGTTLHFMTEKLDAGPIIATTSFPFDEWATGADLYRRADDAAFDLLRKNLDAILEGRVTTTPPHPNPIYRDSRSLDEKRVDPSWPPERIWDFVRALTFPPHAPPFLEIGGRAFNLSIRHEDDP